MSRLCSPAPWRLRATRLAERGSRRRGLAFAALASSALAFAAHAGADDDPPDPTHSSTDAATDPPSNEPTNGPPKAPALDDRAFVVSPIARLRTRDGDSRVLRIGREVQRLPRPRGGKARSRRRPIPIALADGTRGSLLPWQIANDPPTHQALVEKASAEADPSRAVRLWQAATGLAPSSLSTIEGLASALEAKGNEGLLYIARKGWIAAKRRSYGWDGPLYVVDDGRAFFPAGCDERARANGDRRPRDIPRLELRARTEPFASSGKVVSVTERGNTTQRLRAPGCAKTPWGEQLVYRMAKGVERGALVPSWMVAGFVVEPFVDVTSPGSVPAPLLAPGKAKTGANEPAACETCRTFVAKERAVQLDEERARVRWLEEDFGGWRAHPFVSLGPTVADTTKLTPVAFFEEDRRTYFVLFLVDGGRDCAPSELSAFLWRVSLGAPDGDDRPPEAVPIGQRAIVESQTGRLWRQAHVDGCAALVHTPWPGEPRDVSKKGVLHGDWRR